MLQRAQITKTFICILLANVIVFALGNGLKLYVSTIVVLYPLTVMWAASLVFPATVRKTSCKITRGMVWWMVMFCVILSLPRLSYVLEWLPGNIVRVFADDAMRLGQLISMTLSERFPLKLFANPDYTFSYYYAALFPMAFLKLALPFLTLKDVIFLGNAIYHFLILFSLLEIVDLLLPSRRSMWVIIFLFTGFGGLDWLLNIFFHKALIADWQMQRTFQGKDGIYSFFDALFWCIHHVVSFFACLLTFVVLHTFYFKERPRKYFVVGLLMLSAFYSSVFSAMSVLPFCLAKIKSLAKRFKDIRVLVPLGAVFLAAFSVYFNKLNSVLHFKTGYSEAQVINIYVPDFHLAITSSFLWNKILSFPIWLVLSSLADLALIPLFLFVLFSRFSRDERMFFLIAIGFYLSTYFVGMSRYNLYSLRGMFLPMFVFFYLFAKYVPDLSWAVVVSQKSKRWIVIVVGTILSIGTVSDARHLFLNSLAEMKSTHQIIHKDVRQGRFDTDYRNIARDRSITYYRLLPGFKHNQNDYNAEKFMRIPREKMVLGELESLGVRVTSAKSGGPNYEQFKY